MRGSPSYFSDTQTAKLVEHLAGALPELMRGLDPKATLTVLQGKQQRLGQTLRLGILSMLTEAPRNLLRESQQDDAIVQPGVVEDLGAFFKTRPGLVVKTGKAFNEVLATDAGIFDEPVLLRPYTLTGHFPPGRRVREDFGPTGKITMRIIAQMLLNQWDGREGPLRTTPQKDTTFLVGRVFVQVCRILWSKKNSPGFSSGGKWRVRAAYGHHGDYTLDERALFFRRIVPPVQIGTIE